MTPRVLISWSGERSEKIAEVLREWLPTIIPGAEPWLSSEDIRKGGRWSHQLALELESTHFGLLIVLPENQASPWLNFEAGALSKWVEHASVAPLLFDLQPGDLRGPLAQFQATLFTRKDVLRLLTAIASATGSKISTIEKALDFSWVAVESRVKTILQSVRVEADDVAGTSESALMSLSDEHTAVLTKVGTSNDNFMTEKDVTEALGITRAKAQMLLQELIGAGYLAVEHTPMIGNCYRATRRGTKYLIEQGVI